MQQIIEGMIAMIFIFVFLLIGIDLIKVEVDCGNAREFRNSCIVALENSEFDEEIVNRCFSCAKENGYEMSIKFYYFDGTSEIYVSNERFSKKKSVISAEITVNYNLTVPILKETIRKETRGVTC